MVAGEVLSIEIALDEDFDAPCCWAGLVRVVADDGAGALAW